MSHTVTLSYLNKNSALENAKRLLKEFEQTMKAITNPDILELFSVKKNELESLINEYHTFVDQESTYQLERKLAHLDNMFQTLKKCSDHIIGAINDQSGTFSKLLEANGAITIIAIEHLINNKQDVNQTNIETMIKQLSKKTIGQKEIKSATTLINNAAIDPLYRDLWLNKLATMNYKSYADLAAIINDRVRICRELEQAYQDFKKMFEQLDFKFIALNKVIRNEELLYQMILTNQVNNRVKIEFNSQRQINYQLGNYQGHLCEKTTEAFFNMIKAKSDYVIVHYNIIRDDDDDLTLKETEVELMEINKS